MMHELLCGHLLPWAQRAQTRIEIAIPIPIPLFHHIIQFCIAIGPLRSSESERATGTTKVLFWSTENTQKDRERGKQSRSSSQSSSPRTIIKKSFYTICIISSLVRASERERESKEHSKLVLEPLPILLNYIHRERERLGCVH